MFLVKISLVDDLTFNETVFAVLEVAAELLTPQTIDQNVMGHGDSDSTVSLGFDRHPLVGLGGSVIHTRVDNRHSAVFQNLVQFADGIGRLTIG